MAFGQQPGPPASARQVADLLALLRAAGYADFRDARGPMGFTQRQAGGKFTRDEAAALIDRLENAQADASATPRIGPVDEPTGPPAEAVPDPALQHMPSERLAADSSAGVGSWSSRRRIGVDPQRPACAAADEGPQTGSDAWSGRRDSNPRPSP